MVHGNPATHTLWSPLLERLAGERTIYAVDLPGFGGSPMPKDDSGFGRANIARTLVEFAALHGLGRFDLVGHSFGGAIALTIADIAPDRIRSLVAITPMTDAVPPLARLARSGAVRKLGAKIWETVPASLHKWLGSQWTHISYGHAYMQERAEQVGDEADRPDLFRSISELVAHADYGAYTEVIGRLAGCPAPILLVGCGRDRVIPPEHFARLRSRLPNAVHRILPDGCHVPMWQYPDEMAAMLREFWRSEGLRMAD
jgi:pimeloyl-ACP methyl ester carboxylesterase